MCPLLSFVHFFCPLFEIVHFFVHYFLFFSFFYLNFLKKSSAKFKNPVRHLFIPICKLNKQKYDNFLSIPHLKFNTRRKIQKFMLKKLIEGTPNGAIDLCLVCYLTLQSMKLCQTSVEQYPHMKVFGSVQPVKIPSFEPLKYQRSTVINYLNT